ncbi:MAG TPA: MBL fold metallo-hydrolase [Vicinamibacterales bacterium]|nr:MBL fold metallo-hydrolase [Vicinamibacterales bacterium]
MRSLAAAAVVCLTCAAAADQTPADADWKLVVLGIAQDAGIPHLRCVEGACAAARAGKRRAEKVASIGVVNQQSGQAYLFDATPDFRDQVHALTGGASPQGIFLTHAHIGHYTGLMYLGRESIDAREVPVYATARMAAYLRGNGPWSLLVSNRNIALRVVEPGKAVELPGGLRVAAFTVPHRDELSDTVGYRIAGPRATALYVPDTDRWETWPTSIRELADTADLAFLDGSFASPSEVKGRDISEIPHPMMPVTRELLRGVRARLWFIHINHTNAELEADDVVREGMEFDL